MTADERRTGLVRSNLEAIVIRCEEGDKRSDWLPIIARLAREALATLPAASADSAVDGRTAFDALADAIESPMAQRMRAEGATPYEFAGVLINGLRKLGFRILPAASADSDGAGLDVSVVHRITCASLIEHEPGGRQPFVWPCTKFAEQYAALLRP